jgi:uncharacterized membrane protein
MQKDISKGKLVVVPVLLLLLVCLGPLVKGNYLVSAVWVVLLMSLVGLLMGILPEVEWVQSVFSRS